MKIENLKITNFRGIKDISLKNLGTMVVIAGQNGSGKSCLFDAIRLLKSVYGGYQANEWQQWLGEFQIDLANRASSLHTIFNDPTKVLRISCDFRLSEAERNFIQMNSEELIREKIWRTMIPDAYGWGALHKGMYAAQFRDREPEVAERVKTEHALLIQELASPTVRGEVFINPGGSPTITHSITLTVIFSNFRPGEIGVIDYHGAQRHYSRENVQGINLSLESHEQQRSQTALYNYAAKYSNVKGEMAASYVKEILAAQAGIPLDAQSSLTNTLKELFATFFPHKRFLGPQPTQNGGLTFPVETESGSKHDLDELSSGEKEILYGYLRIRNSAPRYSIILLDEPELHLNPRLIRGLPEFYRKNLGETLDNQLWLVTHSDALLREVVSREHYSVFHMLPCNIVAEGESQLKQLSASADIDLVLVDLVGDLAAYRPSAKVVIFEGGGDSDFDQRVVSMLFPELQEQANLLSGSNKTRVRALHETLEDAADKGLLPFKVFSITDRDSEITPVNSSSVNMFIWDVYHIENYLLEPKFISQVLKALHLNSSLNESEVWDELRQCAQDTLPQLIRSDLADYANRALVGAINLGTDPKAADLAKTLSVSVTRSLQKVNNISLETLNEEMLRRREEDARTRYTTSIADGSWTSVVRGRDVLKRFAGKHVQTVPYEAFRNLILSQMKSQNFRPLGMEQVIRKIMEG